MHAWDICNIYHFNCNVPSGQTPFSNKSVKKFYITECREGWYGINCDQPCVGHCRDNATCNHVTGQCDIGCAARWTGKLCDKGSTCDFTSSL